MRQGPLRDFRHEILPLVATVGLLCTLILAGKDFGTTVVMGSVFLLILLVSGVSLKYLFWLVGASLPVMMIALLVEPYRVKRIMAFLNPWENIQTTSFQLYQSLLAVGSGGFMGVGIGESQQKLFYLPEAHTDFIFSIIGEELGFCGAGCVIVLFLALILLGWMVVSRCPDPFGQYLALGVTLFIGLEALINIGVSIGALPTKGLALPFISYGGSSLVVKMAMIGLLLNIAKDDRKKTLSVTSEYDPRRSILEF